MQKSARIGNIQDVYHSDGLLMVVKYALPDVMGFLMTNRSVIQAEQDLRDIGKTIADRMLMVWKPQSSDPIKVLKEIKTKFFKGSKQIKGKILEKFGSAPAKILIREYDCPVCPEKTAEEFKVTEIHYCTSISGFLEGILNYLIKNKRTTYTAASCKTVASVGSGAKTCDMLIELKYGG